MEDGYGYRDKDRLREELDGGSLNLMGITEWWWIHACLMPATGQDTPGLSLPRRMGVHRNMWRASFCLVPLMIWMRLVNISNSI
jgi:hypothetical protein